MNNTLQPKLLGIINRMADGTKIEEAFKIIDNSFPGSVCFKAAVSTSAMIDAMDRIEVDPVLDALNLTMNSGEHYISNDVDINVVLKAIYAKVMLV